MADPIEDVVRDMAAEHKKVLNAHSQVAAIMMTFVFIDSLAKAGLTTDRDVKRADFETWIDTYMKTSDPVEYQYAGKDVYLARCSLLHSYSAESADPSAKKFGYHDGYPHRYRRDINDSLVMISVPLLVDDFYKAVAQFLKDVRGRPDRADVEARFLAMFRVLPYKGGMTPTP